MTIWISDKNANSDNAAAAKNDRNAERNAVTHEPIDKCPMANRFSSFSKRADEEMARWCKTLRHKDRSKLRVQASPWACNGGSIIAPGLRKRRAARRHEKLKRDRETNLRAEHTAYEARRHTCSF